MKIKGIRKAVGETQRRNYTYGGNVQISLNLDTGKVLTAHHIVGGSYMNYDDPHIVHVATVNRPITMEELKRLVRVTLAAHGEQYIL